MVLKGWQPIFINSFLKERTFHVRIRNILSGLYDKEMHVPQRSILSITLFNIKINDIVKTLISLIDFLLYVDNFLTFYWSENINIIERQSQQCLKVNKWVTENWFSSVCAFVSTWKATSQFWFKTWWFRYSLSGPIYILGYYLWQKVIFFLYVTLNISELNFFSIKKATELCPGYGDKIRPHAG